MLSTIKTLVGGAILCSVTAISMGQAVPRWTDAQFVNTNVQVGKFVEAAPSISFGGNGRLHAAWSSNKPVPPGDGSNSEIHYARSLDNGITWIAPQPLTSDVTANDNMPDIRGGKGGAVVTAYDAVVGNTHTVKVRRSTDSGVSWGSPITIHSYTNISAPFAGPQVAHQTGDTTSHWILVHKSMAAVAQVRFSSSTNNGSAWSASQFIANCSFSDRPAIDGDSTGLFLAAFPQPNSAGVSVARLQANTNLGVVAIPGTPLVCEHPSIATNGAGKWIAVFRGSTNFGISGNIYFSVSTNNGVNWSNAAVLVGVPVGSDPWRPEPKIQCDRAGNWIVFYTVDQTLVGGGAFSVHSTDDGVTWGAPKTVRAAQSAEGFTSPDVATRQPGIAVGIWNRDIDGSNPVDALDVMSAIYPSTANLELTLDTQDGEPQVGADYVYFITVINNGPHPARGLQITSQIPATAVFQGQTRTGPGTTAPPVGNTLTLTVDRLEVNEQVLWTIVIRPLAEGPMAVNGTANNPESDADLTDNTASQTVGAACPEQPLVVQGFGQNISNNATSVSTRNGTDFTTEGVTCTRKIVEFTIRNPNSQCAAFVDSLSSSNPAFTIQNNPQGTVIAAGEVRAFQVIFDPSDQSVYQSTILMNYNFGFTPRTFTYMVEGVGGQPIALSGNGVAIANGDSTPAAADNTNFGQSNVACGLNDRDYVITNNSSQAITIGSITAGGDFTVLTALPLTVAAGTTNTFSIRFDPATSGPTTSQVVIHCDETAASGAPLYTFAISGTGGVGNPAAGGDLTGRFLFVSEKNRRGRVRVRFQVDGARRSAVIPVAFFLSDVPGLCEQTTTLITGKVPETAEAVRSAAVYVGACRTRGGRAQITMPTIPGTYLVAVIDPNNASTETNEDNNVVVWPTAF